MKEGLCQCGCGAPTNATFAHGHWAKTIEGRKRMHENCYRDATTPHGNGYFTKAKPGKGHVLEHRLIAEKVLGKPLSEKTELHHVNENRSDNRNCNLVICEDRRYHRLLHQRIAAFKACGHANWRKCSFCGEYDNPKNLYIPPVRGTIEHRRCGNEYRKRQMVRNKAKGYRR